MVSVLDAVECIEAMTSYLFFEGVGVGWGVACSMVTSGVQCPTRLNELCVRTEGRKIRGQWPCKTCGKQCDPLFHLCLLAVVNKRVISV